MSSVPWQGLRPKAAARLVSQAHSQAQAFCPTYCHASPAQCRQGLLGAISGNIGPTQATHIPGSILLASGVTGPISDEKGCTSWPLPLMEKEVEVVAEEKRG